jgi:hypothetical protein
MNDSIEYTTADQLLSVNAGSTWALDYFSFYAFALVGSAGFVLNTGSLLIFMDTREFRIPLYAYLRVYAANNALMCFLSIFNFTSNSMRLFHWANSLPAQIYYNYFYINVGCMCYFFGSAIDIVITLDRIGNFYKRVGSWMQNTRPYVVCPILFGLCFMVNLPYFFQYKATAFTGRLNRTENFTVYFSDTSPFAQSELGKAMVYLVLIIRDTGVLVVQLVLNLSSLFLLKRFLRHKMLMVSRRTTTIPTLNSADPSQLTVTEHEILNENVSNADVRATWMVFIMCMLSICEHALMLANSIYPLIHSDLTGFVLYAVNNFFWALRRFTEPILFYSFNANFRKVLVNRAGKVLDTAFKFKRGHLDQTVA